MPGHSVGHDAAYMNGAAAWSFVTRLCIGSATARGSTCFISPAGEHGGAPKK